VVSSCMSDETYDVIYSTYRIKCREWRDVRMAEIHKAGTDWQDHTISLEELGTVSEELLAEACKEHGYSVDTFKKKAKALGKDWTNWRILF